MFSQDVSHKCLVKIQGIENKIFFHKSFYFIAYLFINISSDNLKLLILNIFSWNYKIVIAVVDRLFSQTNQIDAWHISKRNKSFSWQLHWAAAVPMSFYISPAVNYSEVSHKREGAIFSCMLVINVEFGLSKIRKKQDRRYSDPKACNC